MEIDGKKLTRDQFKLFVKDYDFGRIAPSWLVVHHTWKPKVEDWQGYKSILGLKLYYERLGWKSAPHIFVAPDGIWLFTPMKDVGTHAGEGNATYSLGRLKGYSIGIEVVGDYDIKVWEGEVKANALSVIKTLMDRLKLNTEDIRFHRDYSQKSCPGFAIKKEWIIQNLEDRPQPSPYAQNAWEWQRGLGFDTSISPQEKVGAEYLYFVLKKFNDLRINNKI